MPRKYYLLVGSLPHLPYFRKADQLPINPQRLRWRRGDLSTTDAHDLNLAMDFLMWQRQPMARDDSEMDSRYRAFMGAVHNEALRAFVDYSMEIRSLLACLRRKKRNSAAPSADERCGIGPWDNMLRKNWDRESFGLASVHTWLPEAQSLLKNGKTVDLEILIMDKMWDRLSRIGESAPFGFEAVFAYIFKWDILNRWLSRNQEKATEIFAQLVSEVTGEQYSNQEQ